MRARLDVGGVIGRVWRIYVDQASVLMPAAAVVFVFTGILSALLVAASPGLALVAVAISLVATALFTGMVVELVADVQDGRRDSSAGQLLRAVTPVLGQLIIVAFVVIVAILIGFLLLVVPGLILITIWAVFIPVIVIERPPGLGSLRRSRELVRGNGWQVFGVLFVLFLLVVVVSGLLEAVADSAGTGAGIVVRVILGVLSAPLTALASSVLYFELRGISAGAIQGISQGLGGSDAPGAVQEPGGSQTADPDHEPDPGWAAEPGRPPGADNADAESAFGPDPGSSGNA